jgi:hypothetical protein
LNKIRYFNEMPGWLKTSILLPTAVAAVMSLAEGLALAQLGAVNVEWSKRVSE